MGSVARLAIGTLDLLAVDVVAPVGDLAHSVRYDLDHTDLEWPIDLLPSREALAFARHVVRQEVKLRIVCRIGRLLQLVLSQIADVAMLIPGERVVQQRLAEPIVIELRQVLSLGEEWIHEALHAQLE
jgi:hypothetical protein